MGGMRTYRLAAHAVYECHKHFVFITKYRKPVLKGEIALAMCDITRQVWKIASTNGLFREGLQTTCPFGAPPRMKMAVARRERAGGNAARDPSVRHSARGSAIGSRSRGSAVGLDPVLQTDPRRFVGTTLCRTRKREGRMAVSDGPPA